jgi:hypothetical protein
VIDRAPLPSNAPGPRRGRRSTIVLGAAVAACLAVTACSASNNSTSSSGLSGARGTATQDESTGPALPGWDCGSACTWNGDQADAAVLEAAVTGRSKAIRPASGGQGKGADYAARPLSVDDNEAFGTYLEYRRGFERQGLPFVALPVEGRHLITVVDRTGRAVRGARIDVTDASGAIVARLTTMGDGRAVFNPPATGGAASSAYTATVTKGLVATVATLTAGPAADRVTLDVGPSLAAPALLKLDVMFVIDTSGSMRDELAALQRSAADLAARVTASPLHPELRMGLTVYRDRGDLYASRTFALTADLASFGEALRTVQASGGGDTHEDVQAALHDALLRPGWGDDDTVKVLFLVGDAPPHLDYADQATATYADSGQTAARLGVKVFPIGAVGLDPQGEYIFRQLAQMTAARYVALAPGSAPAPLGATTSIDDGAYGSLPLDEVVGRLLDDELGRVAS